MVDGEPLHAPPLRLFLSSMPCFNLALRRLDELPIKHNFIDKCQTDLHLLASHQFFQLCDPSGFAFIATRLWLSFTPAYLIQMVFSLFHHPLLPPPQHVVTDFQIPGDFTQLLALQHSPHGCYLEFSAVLPMSIRCCSHEPLLS